MTRSPIELSWTAKNANSNANTKTNAGTKENTSGNTNKTSGCDGPSGRAQQVVHTRHQEGSAGNNFWGHWLFISLFPFSIYACYHIFLLLASAARIWQAIKI